jgi:hypothetical protein
MCPIKIRLSEIGKESQGLLEMGTVEGEFLIIWEEQLIAFRSRGFRGAGDMVAAVAKPIARAVDAVLGTDLVNCGGCKQRQEKLNELMPFDKE